MAIYAIAGDSLLCGDGFGRVGVMPGLVRRGQGTHEPAARRAHGGVELLGPPGGVPFGGDGCRLWSGDDPVANRALRRYARWRRAENAVLLGATDTLNRVFGERSVGVAAARRLGLALVSSQPAVRRALVRRALGLAGDLPAIASRPGSLQ